MNTAQDPFRQANYYLRKSAVAKWHRLQSKQHILRSQLGFSDVATTRPTACEGCQNYHGIAYGYNRDTRTILICAMHPTGWEHDTSCPDWLGSDEPDGSMS